MNSGEVNLSPLVIQSHISEQASKKPPRYREGSYITL